MNSTSAPNAGPLDLTFTAILRQEPGKGGWTYVRMEGSAGFFATRGLVKVSGTIDGQPFSSSFMALGKTAYVTGGPDLVTPIRTATNTAGPPITVGTGPDAIAIT